MTPGDYQVLLAQRFSGRKVILATGMVAGSTNTLVALRSVGAQVPLMLAEGIGVGDMPGADELLWKVIGAAGHATIMDNVRAYQAALANPSSETIAAVQHYDPAGEAIVVGALFSEHQELLGRRVYGRRPPAWCALEDKVIIDALWDDIGVARVDVEIVDCDEVLLRAAARRLDRGDGTVWAGDARQGWHGGAELTRWVRSDAAAQRVSAFFASRCDKVRVMPFLEGIPCSIHGIVLPDYVVALRPVESLTLRRPEADGFRYCGCATFYDPPAADRDYMRDMTQRVGEALRARVGFRGTFTIDGVMTVDGFRPTELNPRYGAGINTIAKAFPTLPLYLTHLAICEGEAWDFVPRQLEAMLLQTADATRSGGGHAWCAGERATTETYDLVERDGAYRVAGPEQVPDAILAIGPSPLGTMVRLTLEPARTPVGASVAPRFAGVLELCDRQFGTQFGPSLVARSVR